MKLQFKSSERDTASSIYVKRMHTPYVGGDWHFHKEFELIYFLKGHGMRIVGDHISNFEKGELVLVGQWLPHLWRNDLDALEETSADFIVIKFTRDFEGVDIFSLPELANIENLLKKSHTGILFSENVVSKVHSSLVKLSNSESTDRLINFLNVFRILANSEEYEALSSPGFALPKQVLGENRLQKVINHVTANYALNITLDDISKIAVMTPPAFCRFFKNRTNKTFSHFLNEVRISRACQLLINGENAIKQICYDVGFSSLTNFNRTFKNFKGISPSAYRENYNKLREPYEQVFS